MDNLLPKDRDHISLIVAILGFSAAVIGLLAAVIGRKKEVVNKQEVIHRHASESVQESRPHRPGFGLHQLATWGIVISFLVCLGDVSGLQITSRQIPMAENHRCWT